jgi:periplasmic protein TonB
MFEQTFVDGGQTKRGWSVFVSFAGQILVLLVLALIPLIYTDVLPKAQLTSFLTAPPPPPPPPPPPVVVKVVKIAPKQYDAGRLMAPREIPKQVAIIQEEIAPTVSAGVSGGIPSGLGAIGGGLGSFNVAAPPPPPPPEVKQAQVTKQIRVGGNVQAANLIKKITPVYPALAKSARIQGTVRFTAIIGKDGTIQNLQLVSGHPMLVQSATEAVKQWVYKPTLLNDEPVEVITQIDVNFTLSQ